MLKTTRAKCTEGEANLHQQFAETTNIVLTLLAPITAARRHVLNSLTVISALAALRFLSRFPLTFSVNTLPTYIAGLLPYTLPLRTQSLKNKLKMAMAVKQVGVAAW